MTSRTAQRQEIKDPMIRVTFVENDVDHLEGLINEMKEEMKAQTRILIGILASLVTASVVMAISVVVLGPG